MPPTIPNQSLPVAFETKEDQYDVRMLFCSSCVPVWNTDEAGVITSRVAWWRT